MMALFESASGAQLTGGLAGGVVVWCLLMGGFLVFPAPGTRRIFGPHRKWLWRYLRGELSVRATVGWGGACGGLLWWCVTAGLLSSRPLCALGGMIGGLVLWALVNAGRRAELSPLAAGSLATVICLGLGGVLGLLWHCALLAGSGG